MGKEVFKRSGSEFYYAWFKTDKGETVPRSTRCRDRAAAVSVKREWERRVNDTDYATAQGVLIEDVIEGYLNHLSLKERRAGTLRYNRVKLGHLPRLSPGLRASNVTYKYLEQYLTQRRSEGLSMRGIKKEYDVLHSAFKLAKLKGDFTGDVARIFSHGIEAKYVPKPRWLTPEEVEKILPHLNPMRRAQLALIVATGARLSEAHRSATEDWAPDKFLLRIWQTKTGTTADRSGPIERWCWIPPWARWLIVEFVKDGELVPMSRWANNYRELKAATAAAGIPYCTPNDLRRTYGKWMRLHGVEPNHIAVMLGHATTAMVEKVYGRVSGAELAPLLETKLFLPDAKDP